MPIERGDIRVAAEMTRRLNDGLEMFRAMPTQLPFFTCDASEQAVFGGNRSGKTTAAAVKFAAVARDKPIYGPDGEPIHQRLPWQRNRPLLCWVVGLQLNHIGATIHRVLFRPGLYKIIRDHRTNRWRAFSPDTDSERQSECKPSFPLIPPTEIEKWAWAVTAERQFALCRLKNGTEIYAFASTADVKQGDPVDYIWIDERIARPSHYSEWQARLSDTKGRIVWSSMPWSDNAAMIRVAQRGDEQAQEIAKGDRKKADVVVHRLRFSANPHIDDEEKRKRLEGWTDDERRQRDEGLFLTDNLKIYPSFDRNLHCAIYEQPERDDELSRVLREHNGEPPANWTRTLIIDPGTAKPGVLFCAVPPPEFWVEDEPYLVPYNEIYVPRLIASEVAWAVKQKSGEYAFQSFIIDGQAARQTPMGFALTIGQNISREFSKLNLLCEDSGSGFIPGDPNFQARSMIVDRWLSYRKCGRPQLRIVIDRCPQLVWQMENNLKATETGLEGAPVVLEKPAKGQRDDIRVCLEYYASRNPQWIEPPRITKDLGGMGLRAFKALEKRFERRDPDEGVVHFGPGPKKGTAA